VTVSSCAVTISAVLSPMLLLLRIPVLLLLLLLHCYLEWFTIAN
jgi:hypothetical protein